MRSGLSGGQEDGRAGVGDGASDDKRKDHGPDVRLGSPALSPGQVQDKARAASDPRSSVEAVAYVGGQRGTIHGGTRQLAASGTPGHPDRDLRLGT
jgi:hypothetical protein